MDEQRRRFEHVYEAYSALIYAYAAQRTDDPQDAADIVAETFLVAWRRMDALPPGDQARLWLYGVARRVLANHHRGNRRRQRLYTRAATDLTVALGSPRGPDGPAELATIAAAFDALSDLDREVLTLIAWDGLERAEVAAVLGCSRPAVRVRLHRARSRFDAQLQQLGVQRSTATGHQQGREAHNAKPQPGDA